MRFFVIIPARYTSSRLPAKLLKDIHGKPLIQYVFDNAVSSNAVRVIIATDDERIAEVAQSFGADTCMTSTKHNSGTARIAQVLTLLNISDNEIIVNVQGDEPMLNATLIQQVAKNLVSSNMDVTTLCEPIINKDQYLDSNCVKVVFNKFGKALYFSRSPIPAFRGNDFDVSMCFKHVGIYAYRSGFVKQSLCMDNTGYEQAEKLEQLGMLNEGFNIHVAQAVAPVGFGVDTQQDLDKVRQALDKNTTST